MDSIQDDYLRSAAAKSEYTEEELTQVAKDLQTAIQSRFNKHFERCHLSSGRDYWLLEEADGVWLAFTKSEIAEELTKANIEYDWEKVVRVAYSYLHEFQDRGLTIKVPGVIARQLKDPFFLPIFVSYPDSWKQSEYYTLQRFEQLVWRYEMSPAEALDYWAVERQSQSPHEWARKRGVQPEAVRKNVRQAKDKLNKKDTGASHENATLRVVSVDEIPSGEPHDADEDVFYIPTDESLDVR